MMYWIAGGIVAIAGILWLFRKRGLSKGQQRAILNSHNAEIEQSNQAETEAQQQLQANDQDANEKLRQLAAREAQQRKELENADTEEQVIFQANRAQKNWNDTLQSPWLLGLFLLIWFLLPASVQAATKVELLGIVKTLTQSLNDCAGAVKRERIQHKKQLKDQQIHSHRIIKQKDAKYRQCRKEVLVYQGKAPGNTGLVVGITVASTVAALTTALLLVAIFKPSVFGNTRGTK